MSVAGVQPPPPPSGMGTIMKLWFALSGRVHEMRRKQDREIEAKFRRHHLIWEIRGLGANTRSPRLWLRISPHVWAPAGSAGAIPLDAAGEQVCQGWTRAHAGVARETKEARCDRSQAAAAWNERDSE